MKKSIIAVVLAIATLVTFIIPASAWSWITDAECKVATYKAAMVGEDSITVDAEMETVYLDGTEIKSYPDEEPYRRSAWTSYPEIMEVTRGNFTARIAVNTKGMYIYAEIEDLTIFEEDRDQNPNEGDMFQIYLDWCEPAYGDIMFGGIDMMHPSPEAMYNTYLLEGVMWERSYGYRETWGYSGLMYLGWIAGDYHGNYMGSWGFRSTGMGVAQDKSLEYAYGLTTNGWKCEWFIPWRDEFQAERIERGEQFHCGIGFQAADDSDLEDVVDWWEGENQLLEKSVGITFDQRKEMGLEYYVGYSMLADLTWGNAEYPEGYFGAEVSNGVDIDTSDSVIAIVAALCVAGAGVVLFSRKKKD